MNDQRVRFIQTKQTRLAIIEPDRFEFRADRKLWWLQKAAIWVLRKLRCNSYREAVSFEYIDIDKGELIENVMTQIRAFWQDRRKAPTSVLVGARQLREWMHTPMARDMMNVNCQYYSVEGGVKQICGLNVTIVPWMDGVLVMP
jgi:hypothetical protein